MHLIRIHLHYTSLAEIVICPYSCLMRKNSKKKRNQNGNKFGQKKRWLKNVSQFKFRYA